MTITARIIANSISEDDVRLTTMELMYPRFIHAEFMTHRVFSRNASSSRAIPVAKMIEQVRTNPAVPIHFGKNQPGMQAREELTGEACREVKADWMFVASVAAEAAKRMAAQGAHKQVVNRILEPFQHIHVVVTATDWDNFFQLRAHDDAQPEIRELALQMRAAMNASTPVPMQFLDWHLPYIQAHECQLHATDVLRKCSAARCARVSYLTHDGATPSIEKDLELFERLVGSVPIHASPTEHQATPAKWLTNLHGNFRGWVQHRKLIENRAISLQPTTKGTHE